MVASVLGLSTTLVSTSMYLYVPLCTSMCLYVPLCISMYLCVYLCTSIYNVSLCTVCLYACTIEYTLVCYNIYYENVMCVRVLE